MEITNKIKDIRKKRRWSLSAAQWGSGEELHENKNWKTPPSGKLIKIEFSLTNEEIRKWGKRPEWQISRIIGQLAKFSVSVNDGQINVHELSGDFKPQMLPELQGLI